MEVSHSEGRIIMNVKGGCEMVMVTWKFDISSRIGWRTEVLELPVKIYTKTTLYEKAWTNTFFRSNLEADGYNTTSGNISALDVQEILVKKYGIDLTKSLRVMSGKEGYHVACKIINGDTATCNLFPRGVSISNYYYDDPANTGIKAGYEYYEKRWTQDKTSVRLSDSISEDLELVVVKDLLYDRNYEKVKEMRSTDRCTGINTINVGADAVNYGAGVLGITYTATREGIANKGFGGYTWGLAQGVRNGITSFLKDETPFENSGPTDEARYELVTEFDENTEKENCENYIVHGTFSLLDSVSHVLAGFSPGIGSGVLSKLKEGILNIVRRAYILKNLPSIKSIDLDHIKLDHAFGSLNAISQKNLCI